MNLLLALFLATQGAAPLRKSDLVRLLSASAMSSEELAQFVGRNCLTFEPTERDRTDWVWNAPGTPQRIPTSFSAAPCGGLTRFTSGKPADLGRLKCRMLSVQ